jgi:predicted MPP superfamily phosphohydrolase
MSVTHACVAAINNGMLFRAVRSAFNAVVESLERRVVTRPFSDVHGDKGWWSWLPRAPAERINRVRIGIAGWPQFGRPLRILFLSDLHVGSHTGDVERLTRIAMSTAELQPDLMCVGGDYINGLLFGGGRVPPETTAAILGRVKPPLGSFAVLGDHDEIYGAPAIARALRDAGLTVLLNEAASIAFEGHEIEILGVTPDVVRSRDLIEPAHIPRIVLAHDPAAFARLPRDSADLMLCGHTHGGQIQLPLVGPLVNMSDAPLRWTYGHVVEGDCHLYVTSGLGTSVMPLRLGIPPEVVLIEVHGVYRPRTSSRD